MRIHVLSWSVATYLLVATGNALPAQDTCGVLVDTASARQVITPSAPAAELAAATDILEGVMHTLAGAVSGGAPTDEDHAAYQRFKPLAASFIRSHLYQSAIVGRLEQFHLWPPAALGYCSGYQSANHHGSKSADDSAVPDTVLPLAFDDLSYATQALVGGERGWTYLKRELCYFRNDLDHIAAHAQSVSLIHGDAVAAVDSVMPLLSPAVRGETLYMVAITDYLDSTVFKVKTANTASQLVEDRHAELATVLALPHVAAGTTTYFVNEYLAPLYQHRLLADLQITYGLRNAYARSVVTILASRGDLQALREYLGRLSATTSDRLSPELNSEVSIDTLSREEIRKGRSFQLYLTALIVSTHSGHHEVTEYFADRLAGSNAIGFAAKCARQFGWSRAAEWLTRRDTTSNPDHLEQAECPISNDLPVGLDEQTGQLRLFDYSRV
ncbi:hypothetical protein IWQ60_000653 [Tieghemiomyces parasiticus]|uniref:Uncharacterized protein n=1 Tax=Tieghemiomyces parasiticus TaxID=78921 RepID=A0A9W8AI48_9FUNG|nr:hypothetical protein IWQ60_000653 [Tieghemiomyces parasiticus]